MFQVSPDLGYSDVTLELFAIKQSGIVDIRQNKGLLAQAYCWEYQISDKCVHLIISTLANFNIFNARMIKI